MDQIPVTMAASGATAPVRAPSRRVRPSEVIELVAIRTNTQNVAFSTSGQSAAQNGPRELMTPSDTPRPVVVQNLDELWIYSAANNEGLLINIYDTTGKR